MVGPTPSGSTLATTRPDSVVSDGYIQLSGTSFAAPVVSGAAAYLLALNPTWTPDQIKGALMLAARPEPSATPGSVGVGLVDVIRAGGHTSPPNPNARDRPVPRPGPERRLDPGLQALRLAEHRPREPELGRGGVGLRCLGLGRLGFRGMGLGCVGFRCVGLGCVG